MTEIHGPGGPVPHIPDDLTIVQFMLDYQHVSRPVTAESQANPWMIEDATGREVTFSEIRTRVDGLANAISLRWSIREDDVVCIFSPNHVDYPVAIWAVHRLGGIVTAANPAYTTDELQHQIVSTKARVMIVHSQSHSVALSAALSTGMPLSHIVLLDVEQEFAPPGHCTLQQLIQEGLSRPLSFTERRLKPGEAETKLAFFSFSSGTTGKAKAVCIPHTALVAAVIQMAHLANSQNIPWEERKLRAGDKWMALLPFYHISGLVVVLHFGLFYGTTLVAVPRFNFVEVLKSIERHRIHLLPVVPPTVVLLCKHPAVKEYDLTSLRMIMSGAAPLSAELIHQLSAVFPWISIGQGYGMTETVTSISFPQIEQKIGTPGSAGRLVPGITARVVRADGSLASYNEVGQLLVKGPSMALGYMDNEEATKETFVNGWIYTGDEVMVNEQAEVFILDRIKELLKVKGFQVAPAELEGHLLDHPAVSDVCVVGIKDEYNGELPFAFVVPSKETLEQMENGLAEANNVKAALIKHVADAKVHYKWLVGVEFTESIPKNPSGKLLRRVLRDRARELQEQGEASYYSESKAMKAE